MTDSPISPAPTPPGDFSNDPFLQSPSTWLAIVAAFAPLITVTLKDNAPAVIEALTGLAPLIAFVALIIQRNKNHRNVQQLNLVLAQDRMAQERVIRLDRGPCPPAPPTPPAPGVVEVDEESTEKLVTIQQGDNLDTVVVPKRTPRGFGHQQL